MSGDSFYKYSSDIVFLTNKLIANNGEGEEADFEQLQQLSGLIKGKVDSCAEYMSFLQDNLGMKKARIKEMQEAYKIEENKLDRLKRYYISCIRIASDEGKLEGVFHKMTITKPRKRVDIVDIDSIPARFLEVKRDVVPLKKDIMDEYKKTGKLVVGTRLVDGEEGLKIK